jgi:lipopolysaccharide transport system ATP-binding protein
MSSEGRRGEELKSDRVRQAPIICLRRIGKKFRIFENAGQRLQEALHPFRKKYHREFWALRDIDFVVPRGSCIGIIGRNGSGKSTLLKIIAGVMQPSEGVIEVDGQVAALLELGAGFNPDLSGRENALLQLQIANIPINLVADKIDYIERFAEIGEHFDRPIRAYSSGMLIRVAFAAAICAQPDVLIVDEALAVGDSSFQQKCLAQLRDMQNAGMTLLIVTHDMATVARICSRCLVLDKHRVIYDGEVRLAVNEYENILFGGDRRSDFLGPDTRQSSAFPAPDKIEQLTSNPIVNAVHSKLGDGRAEMLDFQLIAGERVNVAHILSGEELTIFARFHFHFDCNNIAFGIGITTPEGVLVFGTNTDLMGVAGVDPKAGQMITWRARVKPNLASGKYFLNVGCTEISTSGPVFVDVRRAIALFEVDAPRHASGVAVFECVIEHAHGYDGAVL